MSGVVKNAPFGYKASRCRTSSIGGRQPTHLLCFYVARPIGHDQVRTSVSVRDTWKAYCLPVCLLFKQVSKLVKASFAEVVDYVCG